MPIQSSLGQHRTPSSFKPACSSIVRRRPTGWTPSGRAVRSLSPLSPGSARTGAPAATNTDAAGDSDAPLWQQRTVLLMGGERSRRLREARVLVVGLGGVGSYAAEFLARAGVGALTLVDGDVVDITNTNRQLHAMHSTVNQSKAQLMAQRLRDVAPEACIVDVQHFLLPDEVGPLIAGGMLGPEQSGSGAAASTGSEGSRLGAYDWVVDCIDSLEPKKRLILESCRARVPVITACGAGGRLDPSKVRVVPLSSTHNDPFAANLRKDLRRRGVTLDQIPAVWSDEPVTPSSLKLTDGSNFKKSYHGTISYLPAQFGLLAAAYVINALVGGPMAAAYQQLPTESITVRQKQEAVERRRAKRLATAGSSSSSSSRNQGSSGAQTRGPAETGFSGSAGGEGLGPRVPIKARRFSNKQQQFDHQKPVSTDRAGGGSDGRVGDSRADGSRGAGVSDEGTVRAMAVEAGGRGVAAGPQWQSGSLELAWLQQQQRNSRSGGGDDGGGGVSNTGSKPRGAPCDVGDDIHARQHAFPASIDDYLGAGI